MRSAEKALIQMETKCEHVQNIANESIKRCTQTALFQPANLLVLK